MNARVRLPRCWMSQACLFFFFFWLFCYYCCLCTLYSFHCCCLPFFLLLFLLYSVHPFFFLVQKKKKQRSVHCFFSSFHYDTGLMRCYRCTAPRIPRVCSCGQLWYLCSPTRHFSLFLLYYFHVFSYAVSGVKACMHRGKGGHIQKGVSQHQRKVKFKKEDGTYLSTQDSIRCDFWFVSLTESFGHSTLFFLSIAVVSVSRRGSRREKTQKKKNTTDSSLLHYQAHMRKKTKRSSENRSKPHSFEERKKRQSPSFFFLLLLFLTTCFMCSWLSFLFSSVYLCVPLSLVKEISPAVEPSLFFSPLLFVLLIDSAWLDH